MRDLVSLIYCSKMSDFARRLDEKGLIADLVSVSRWNNARRSLTGALLSGAGFFAQVLEGECDLVGATMAAIEADRRHEQVNILQVRSISVRDFKGWSMADASLPTDGRPLDGTLTSTLLARAHAGEKSTVGALHGLLRTCAAADPSWNRAYPPSVEATFPSTASRPTFAPSMM